MEQTDHWTAKIKAAQSLRGKFGNYTLNVEARDLGTPSNKDKGILTLIVFIGQISIFQSSISMRNLILSLKLF